MSKPGYQPEIDGLRAVAVVSVLLFHAGFATLSGGYVGVDVFFVISGYLITRIITDEVGKSGSFRFGNFYLRRIRRLFPAALCTIAFSFVGAALLFSPENVLRFGASAAAAVLSVSNFYFWAESGYFSPDVINKPLLHTWSLSVEEQFYMVWPAFLVLVLIRLPRLHPLVLLAGLVVGSTVIAEYWIFADPSAAFYLLPPRVAELGIGAIMVWVMRLPPPPNAIREALLVLGLALIAYAALFFEELTPFPGMNALVPCLGTALVLYGCEARFAGIVLRLPPVVWIGRISYSLYLVHWPIIVFYYALTFTDFGPADRWIIVGLSFALAALQYYLIEERFRHPVPGRAPTLRFLLSSAAGALIIGLLAGTILLTNGWPGRIPEERFQASNRDQRHLQDELFCNSPDPSKPADLFTCQNYRGKDRDIVLWGDSHALHLVGGFSKWFPDYNTHVLFVPGCVPQSGFAGYVRNYGSDEKSSQECADRNRSALEYFEGQAVNQYCSFRDQECRSRNHGNRFAGNTRPA